MKNSSDDRHEPRKTFSPLIRALTLFLSNKRPMANERTDTVKAKIKKKHSGHHKQVYSVEEASEFLAVSESTVRRLVSRGELRASRTNGNTGGRILISRRALEEFLGGV